MDEILRNILNDHERRITALEGGNGLEIGSKPAGKPKEEKSGFAKMISKVRDAADEMEGMGQTIF